MLDETETYSRLKVIHCTDRSRWYAEHVGEVFPLLDLEEGHYEYKTRQADGYINYILKKDALLLP